MLDPQKALNTLLVWELNWQISNRNKSLSAYALWTRLKRKVLTIPSCTQGYVWVQCRGPKNLLSFSAGLLPGCGERETRPKLDMGSEAGLPLPPLRKHMKVTVAFHFFFFFCLRVCRQLCYSWSIARKSPSSITYLGRAGAWKPGRPYFNSVFCHYLSTGRIWMLKALKWPELITNINKMLAGMNTIKVLDGGSNMQLAKENVAWHHVRSPREFSHKITMSLHCLTTI